MKPELKHMLDEVDLEARYTVAYTGRSAFSSRVMAAMAEVDRVDFVPKLMRPFAYFNQALSIGYGQTISQPYIVALMTDLLDLDPQSTVLEIGTGSGYQAAVLSRLADRVYSIETVRQLYAATTTKLHALGYNNIETRCGDGYHGWAEKGPFDAVIVTAAATHIPPDLIEQLKPEGRMVIPLGLPHMHQELMLLYKRPDGSYETRAILGVVFVPLVVDESNDKQHISHS